MESQTYITTSGIIKAVFTKEGEFITMITNKRMLRAYPLSRYKVIDII